MTMTKLIALAIVTMISCSSLALANEEKGTAAPATGTVEQTNNAAPAAGKTDAQPAKKAHKAKKAKK